MKSIKNNIKTITSLCLGGCLLFLSTLAQAQCVPEGHKSDLIQGNGSVTARDNQFSTEAVLGQTFISTQLNSYTHSSAAGYWSVMLNPPIIAGVKASDGTHEDRIQLSWSVNRNTPSVTSGFKVYKDGYLIGTVGPQDYSFIDYNIVPGVYYTYGVSGVNAQGEGNPTEDLGYVNPNGVVSGRVTTFSGNSVEGAVVTLSPSNNLALHCRPQPGGGGGLYVDTLESNTNPLVDSLFTLSLWAKTEDYTTQGLLFDYGSNDNENFWMGVEDDESIYVKLAGKKVSFKIPGTNTQNQWHHIAATYNGRNLTLYFDGVFAGATSINHGDIKYANNRIGIGCNAVSTIGDNQYDGFIDEVRLLTKVQRPSEIKKLMYNTVPSDYEGLVAYWKMDEGKGERIIDQVEPERVGRICGAVFSSHEEPGVQIAGISDASGNYLIEGVNYKGGTNFRVEPNKFVSNNTALEFNDVEGNYAQTSEIEIAATSTIEFWFSPYHYDDDKMLIDADGDLLFHLFLNKNNLYMNLDNHLAHIATLDGYGYKHLTLVKEGGTVTTYIGGQEVSITEFPYSAIIPKTTYQLGRRSGGGTHYSGLMDALVIYNKALAIADIQEHEQSGVQSRVDTVNGLSVVNENITTFIHFNDQEGNEIVNDVPNRSGVLEYGSVHGAEFVDIVAHENGVAHEFQPNSRNVTLDNSNTSVDQIDFVDITTVPVTGVVKYENSNCFIQYAEILIDGASTSPPTFTNENGEWTIELEPGQSAQISASFQSHKMFPDPFFEVKRVFSPVAGIVFEDLDLRTVSGIVAGGLCELPIVDENKTITVSLKATDGCYQDEIVLGHDSSIEYEFVDVPPGEYSVGVTHSDGASIGIGEYFDTKGGVTVDVLEEDAEEIDFIYRKQHDLELSQLDTNQCGEVTLNQGINQSITIKVFEEYLEEKCYLDTATIKIIEGIGFTTDASFTGTHEMVDGEFTYKFAAGEANIVSPYKKSTQVFAEVEGNTETSERYEAVVLGKRKRETTFTTTTPELPLTILRDPPGDQSYTSLDKSQEVCMTGIKFITGGLTIGRNFEVSAGADVTTSVGIGAETELSVDVTAKMGVSASVNVSGGLNTEHTFCTTLDEVLETSAIAENLQGDFIVGQDADIYIGAALNIEYGLTDVLSYNVSSCKYELSTELMVDPKTFETYYAYTEYHLKNDVIPSNYLLKNEKSAKAWEEFILLNKTTKDQARFVENRSFDAGIVYTQSKTTSKSDIITKDFSFGLDASITSEVGVEVNGVGVTLTDNIDITMSYGGSTANGVTKSQTISYTLADDDLEDNFTVNIYEDLRFGTPVFKVVSGESMCPWEPGTQPREGVQLLVDNAKESSKFNIASDQAALFELYLGNTSESDEKMTYAVDVVNSSNPKGAVLSINGHVLGATGSGGGGQAGANNLTYTIDPLVAENAKLAVEMGADPNIFEYDSIQVVLQSLCDGQFSDTIMISAHFVEPCSPVAISKPAKNWVITPKDQGELSVVVYDYDETDPDLELIRVQYREAGTPSWLNVKETIVDSLEDVSTQLTWEIGSLKDGDYELRALTKCTGGIPASYSEVMSGKIERQPPVIFGEPEPSDGVLDAGEEISITFNEKINCNEIFKADQNGVNNIGLYLQDGGLVNADYHCIDRKITVVPNVPINTMENRTLEVRVTEIEDLVGNVLGVNITGDSIHKWDFYVDVSPVGWSGAAIEVVMVEGEDLTFTRVIENSGGTNVNYELELPSYISASSTSGVLPAGGQQTVTFEIDRQLVNGEYAGNLGFKSSYGTEELPFDIRVICPTPAWSVDPSAYTFNMNYTVQLDMEGEQSIDDLDIVAGVIDGEIRGVANIQYVSSIDKYLAFLSVYGNEQDKGSQVTFKLWDASECKLYDGAHESFPFKANGQVGTPAVQDTIHSTNVLASSIDLEAGWNWISFNLNVDDGSVNNVMSTIVEASGGLIKSQTGYSQYSQNGNAWVGSLIQVDEKSMYQVFLEEDAKLNFYGSPIDIEEARIPISIGWNWIGYVPQGGMTPAWAFQKLKPLNGDLIKNQFLFAQYVNGAGWIGNLNYMNAPSGYLYKSSVIDTLVYPRDANTPALRTTDLTIGQKEVKDDIIKELAKVNLSPNQYSANMNIVSIGVNAFEEVVTGYGDKVYAYIGNEVRGVAECKPISNYAEKMFFLTVFGNTEDEGKSVSFRYHQVSSGNLFEVKDTLIFSNNDIVGDVESNQHLRLSSVSATSEEKVKSLTTNMVSVYPNPFSGDALISLYSEKEQQIQLSISDNLGRSIGSSELTVVKGTTELNFSDVVGKPNKGVYHISLVIGSEVYNEVVVCQ